MVCTLSVELKTVHGVREVWWDVFVRIFFFFFKCYEHMCKLNVIFQENEWLMLIPVTRLWLNSTFLFWWLTRTRLWFDSFEPEFNSKFELRFMSRSHVTALHSAHLQLVFGIELLTLAGTGHFASFHGTRGGGTTPLAVSPLIELELRGKKRACSSPRDEEIDI